jgi:hypothetical protein
MRIFISVIIGLLIGIIGAGTYFLYLPVETIPVQEPEKIEESAPITLQRYTDEATGLTFEYPSLLNMQHDRHGRFTLAHNVPYRHHDFCDMIGDGVPDASRFVDMHLEIRQSAGSLMGLIRSVEYSSDDLIDEEGNPKLSEGFFEEVKIGSHEGFVLTRGVEGCGENVYYFPHYNGIIAITRQLVPELTSLNLTRSEFEMIPGVILPQDEKAIFTNLVKSIRFE